MALPSFSMIIVITICLLPFFFDNSSAQLSTNYYSSFCPNALSTVKSDVQSAISKEQRMGTSRLHFHDCFVNLGGPSWNVILGRRDARTASQAAANSSIPPPTPSISSFQAQGLSTKDMVALSGSHTIGQARCTNFRNRIYNETNIDASFARTRQANCPRSSGSGDNNIAPLDVQTHRAFNNHYYNNLVNSRGLLHSDQQLFNSGSTNSQVRSHSNYPSTFNADFAAAMIKMGERDIKPLTGSKVRLGRIAGGPTKENSILV